MCVHLVYDPQPTPPMAECHLAKETLTATAVKDSALKIKIRSSAKREGFPGEEREPMPMTDLKCNMTEMLL